MAKRKYAAAFKAKVAIEALKEEKTISEIASKYSIHPQLVSEWNREFIKNAYKVFETQHEVKKLKVELEKAYKKIGQLRVENDFW